MSSREIDLLAQLPEMVAELREVQVISSVEQPQIKTLWDALYDCLDDQFIQTATSLGVARRENMLEILPPVSDTLAQRKTRLLTRYNENIPYTRKTLHGALCALCGENGYEMTVDDGLTLTLYLQLTMKHQRETIAAYLERVLPCNMVFLVLLRYNTWRQAGAYTWGEAGEKSWCQVKEEVM